MKIAVIGTGYVGLTAACFIKFDHEIILIGRTQSKIDAINKGICPIYELGMDEILKEGIEKGKIHATTDYDEIKDCESVFICVGTPSREDGSIDLSQIRTASESVGKQLRDGKYRVVVVKSTVVPGTSKDVVTPILEKASGKKVGKDFGVCMNPEFLREGTGVYDFLNPDKIVIGAHDDRSYKLIEKIYEGFDKNAARIQVGLSTAEMIKYAQNSALATRISFMNEVANICEKYSVDVSEVAHAIGLDPRIGPRFLRAGAGFGGSCFPKDVKALRATALSAGITPHVLNGVLEVNKNQPYRVVELAKEAVGNLKNKKVAILGLAFKPDTDDMREASSIPIINTLLKDGAIITVYDPKAMENTKKVFGDKIKYADSKEACVKNADICLIVTEWKDFKNIDLSNIACPIVDGRRILDPEKVAKHNIVYKGIGWKNNQS